VGYWSGQTFALPFLYRFPFGGIQSNGWVFEDEDEGKKKKGGEEPPPVTKQKIENAVC
jgi:hypothetical protein